jgi:hypothetical protein
MVMSVSRMGVISACTLGLLLTTGAVQAGAGNRAHVLQFRLVHIQNQGWTGPYWNRHTNPPTPAPPGEQAHITGIVLNNVEQFGQPANARVGRILLDCTVFTSAGDGLCVGIVHLPDGYFTIAGNGPFVDASVRYYAVTGGIGPYAIAHGQMKTIRATEVATVTLYS